MAVPAELKRGMVLRHEGGIYVVVDYVESKSGKQKGTVHVTLRELATGRMVDRSLAELGKLAEAASQLRPMQYLYAAGDEHVFMDSQTYEQVSFSAERLAHLLDFLVIEQEYRVLTVEDRAVSVQVPDQVALEVSETASPAHMGGTGSNVYKEAKLETGMTVLVPLFIKTGDRIRVDTQRREYAGKET